VVIRTIDSITKTAALISAWMFFSIGMMVTYEVIMRKIFNSPTIWVDEVARFFQVWAVYLAGAHILKERKLITVELFASSLSERTLNFFEIISLAIIGIFSLIATYYGSGVVLESIEMGRKTSTMLGVPKWITESAIPVGFGLLLVQTLVEYVKLLRGGNLGPAAGHDI
jgi:C4-dicarboxylate transporter, DctQ subunit